MNALPIPAVEEDPLPAIPPELQALLDGNELVQLTEQPARGSIVAAVEHLQEVEELCVKTAVMKVHNPEIKMRDRIAEIDCIVDNAKAVLQRVLSLRSDCVRACEKAERQFIQYIACVKHNTQILTEEEVDLKKEDEQIVTDVGDLNAHNIELKNAHSELQKEVRVEAESNA